MTYSVGDMFNSISNGNIGVVIEEGEQDGFKTLTIMWIINGMQATITNGVASMMVSHGTWRVI